MNGLNSMQTSIIIPIYNAYEMLDGLFQSLFKTVVDAPIIVINDASPDKRVQTYLDELHHFGFKTIKVLKNEHNQGFVKTVNRGMSLVAGDVIILNQDTVVTEGWYTKLITAAKQPNIATVTPLTNNGEIASIPIMCEDNGAAGELELMGQACDLAGAPEYPEIPTAVGFCMLLTYSCRQIIGEFDAETFGHGYGEENDYSRRAVAAGYRNILCDNAYVAHIGNQSFKDFGLQPNDMALQHVLARHPDYLTQVSAFINDDPLQKKRQQIDNIYKKLVANKQSIDMTETKLEFTGERFTPECVREIWYEHMHRYAFVGDLTKGLSVCDAACGEGYGTALLRSFGAQAIGVDIDANSISHAKQRYGSGFYRASVTSMPFDDDMFDAVVSFETIEHLHQHEEMLLEFQRILKSNGFLVISSPDKKWYSDDTGYDNPHHVKELYRDEFVDLLKKHFKHVKTYGQKLLFQSVIWPEGVDTEQDSTPLFHQAHHQEGQSSKQSPYPALYNIAICADEEAHMPVNLPGLCLFGDKEESVYSHYSEQVRKNIKAGHDLMERDRQIAELQARIQQLSKG